jgi:hypothetical protein
MGTFYTNIVINKVQQNAVADYLKKQDYTAYVSPTIKDFTFIYPKVTEDQDTKVIIKFTKSLSKKFKCGALASLVHDSDIYMYWLFENGKEIDTYNSCPHYFDEDNGDDPTPSGGNATKLCSALNKKPSVTRVQDIFDQVKRESLGDGDAEEYLFAENIHLELARALDMPEYLVDLGFYSIEEGCIPEKVDRDLLIKV